ncbi:DUF3301 domain-containing protein [Acidihalobacter prosperus]
MNELLLALLAAVVWAWVDALRAREAALRACRRTCERLGLQLLDETVALRHLRLRRDADGRLRLRRHYGFEYSERGSERRQGEAVLLGRRVESVRGDWIEGQVGEAPRPHGSDAQSSLRHPHAPTDFTAGNDERAPVADNVVQLSDFRARSGSPRDRRG